MFCFENGMFVMELKDWFFYYIYIDGLILIGLGLVYVSNVILKLYELGNGVLKVKKL